MCIYEIGISIASNFSLCLFSIISLLSSKRGFPLSGYRRHVFRETLYEKVKLFSRRGSVFAIGSGEMTNSDKDM